jgi:dipeptidyl aminopeptidase/acylaminoacyl peptidase
MKTGSVIVWSRAIGCWAVGIALLAGTFAGAYAQTAGTPPPVEHFFENNAFGGAKLSPSGRYLAVRMSKPERRIFLAVFDLETRQAKAVAEFRDADIGEFQWVNDERLVYNLFDTTEASGDWEEPPGLFAVNRDGSNYIQLANRTRRGGAPQPWNTYLLDQPGSQDSVWIYVQRPMYDSDDKYFGTRLRRLNTLTGKSEVAPEPDVEVSSYMLDAKGEPRLALLFGAIKTVIFYRDPATDTWRKMASYDSYNNARDAIKPLGFGPDGTLFVVANAGEDMATLRTFDVAAGTVSKEALVVARGYDFEGSLVITDKVLGVRLTTDAESNVWFDPAMKELQAAVDKALPGTVNMISVPARAGAPWLLVASYSDRQPLRYLVYDAKTGVAEVVGITYPKIEPARMARQEPIRYKARDGLEIPGLLTLPAGGAQEPADGGAGPWRPLGTWRELGLEPAIAIPRVARLCGPAGGISWQHRLWRTPFRSRPEAMGPGHAERYRRRHPLGHRPGHRRPQADLHRRRQLWRLCGADGAGQRSGTVSLRYRLDGRDRH